MGGGPQPPEPIPLDGKYAEDLHFIYSVHEIHSKHTSRNTLFYRSANLYSMRTRYLVTTTIFVMGLILCYVINRHAEDLINEFSLVHSQTSSLKSSNFIEKVSLKQ